MFLRVKSLKVLLGVLGMLSVSGVAMAQGPQCAPRQVVVERLAEKFQEVPVAHGVNSKGILVEVFASSDGSTWSIIGTTPAGMSCFVTDGEGWTSVAPVEVEEPEA